MAVLADIVIDCQHPAVLARFWADVLDGYQIAPYENDGLIWPHFGGVATV